jgi:hypothetical protein
MLPFIFKEIQRISTEIGYQSIFENPIAKQASEQFSLWHFTIGGIFK